MADNFADTFEYCDAVTQVEPAGIAGLSGDIRKASEARRDGFLGLGEYAGNRTKFIAPYEEVTAKAHVTTVTTVTARDTAPISTSIYSAPMHVPPSIF